MPGQHQVEQPRHLGRESHVVDAALLDFTSRSARWRRRGSKSHCKRAFTGSRITPHRLQRNHRSAG